MKFKKNKIKDKFNGIQVINFHNRSTEPLNYRIYARPQSIKQARRPEFYKYTDRLSTHATEKMVTMATVALKPDVIIVTKLIFYRNDLSKKMRHCIWWLL